MSARSTALAALIACRKTNAWSDGVLKEYIRRDRLDSRDAALASRLCYGVVQNRMLLDFYLSHFVKGSLGRLQPVVLDILRLGAYQLTMMDRVPPSAAVNESVELGKRYANHRAAGLINGVLRAMTRAETLPEPASLDVRYSHPRELVALLRENVGEDLLEPLLRCDNEAPKTVVQANPLKITEHALLAHWEERGIEFERHPWMPGCYLLSGFGSLEALDCCAAPGGKSFAAAMEMNNQGQITACDIHSHKLALIEKGAARLGVEIVKTAACDASLNQPRWNGAMDAVIADVPCSGLGVIRKKPDIRYKDLTPLEDLPAVQGRILDNVSRYVRPGGVLLYSTCTILRRENEQVVQAFLADHPEFAAETLSLPQGLEGGDGGMLTLLPCLHHCDGFFIAKLRRRP